MLVDEDDEDTDFTVMDGEQLREHIRKIVIAHDGVQKPALERRHVQRQQSRVHRSREKLPHFIIDDYVLVATVRKEGRNVNILATWIWPWQVPSDDREPQEVYVAHTDYKFHVPSQLWDIF